MNKPNSGTRSMRRAARSGLAFYLLPIASILLCGCASFTSRDGKVQHVIGYARIIKPQTDHEGVSSSTETYGLSVSADGLCLGRQREKTAVIPPGKALYIYVTDSADLARLQAMIDAFDPADVCIVHQPD